MKRIRSACKAVIVQDGRVLLQQCRFPPNTIYYELPGGGQRPGETMEEAVRRECLEETGYAVGALRPFALLEEILTDEGFAAAHPGFAHRIFHVFRCEIDDSVPRCEPDEADDQEIGLCWVPLSEVEALLLRPAAMRPVLAALAAEEEPMRYLGAKRFSALED